ncbi:ski oncogene-like [Tubulanus polymorphus]|uniref:ski oncogene-like n=1 Tax=Tubulanus polymorphus TaxID=672921 RepID=UPI003DA2394B
MDQMPPPAFNPHLQRVLKSFQTAAMRSLSGPSNYVAAWGEQGKLSQIELEEYRKALALAKKHGSEFKTLESAAYDVVPPFPIQQMPLLIPMDNSRSEKSSTELETEPNIACFVVGGEKRLCLPQILNTVLRDYSLQQINAVCDELHIFCSRCNPDQLETLKHTGVLPLSAPSCGLITKTDAQRLCNALIHPHRDPEKNLDPPSSHNSFKVYHECFGKCKGLMNPDLYETDDAKCIQCTQCRGMFSPRKFVCHSHKSQENRTCHWGFDSQNWRYYLLLADDDDEGDANPRVQEALEKVKSKFDPSRKFKRKLKDVEVEKNEIKRAKNNDVLEHIRISAFQPWCPIYKDGKHGVIRADSGGKYLPSYLHSGPPVLLNPERVVPDSQSENEPQFAPNVTLAPVTKRFKSNSTDDIKKEDAWDASDTDSVCGSSPLIGSPRRYHDELSFEDVLERQVIILQQALDGKVTNHKSCIQHFQQLSICNLQAFNKTLADKKSLEKEIEVLRLLTRATTPPQKPLTMPEMTVVNTDTNETDVATADKDADQDVTIDVVGKYAPTKPVSPATTDNSWSPSQSSPRGNFPEQIAA